MAEETQYVANLGMATLTTANSSMVGASSVLVLTGATSAAGYKGTFLKTIYIKAQQSTTTAGIIRFFINNSTKYRLIAEVNIPLATKSAVATTFEARLDLNLCMAADYNLYATVSQDYASGGINIFAEGMNYKYYSTSVRADTTQYTFNMGRGNTSTANTNLDGTGTLATIFTAGSSGTYKGASIEAITLKSIVNNTAGMYRLFIKDTGSTKKLIMEVPVPTVTKAATDQAFEHVIVFDNNLDLPAGYSVLLSTEKAEQVNGFVEAKDWNYVA